MFSSAIESTFSHYNTFDRRCPGISVVRNIIILSIMYTYIATEMVVVYFTRLLHVHDYRTPPYYNEVCAVSINSVN